MRLEADPRLSPGNFFQDAKDWMRRAAQLLNPTADASDVQAGQITALQGRAAALETPAVFSASLSSNQALTAATFTQIAFNAEDFDTAGAHSVATGRFTAPAAGYYAFEAAATVTASGGSIGNAQLLVYKNGTAFRRGPASFASNGTALALSMRSPVMLLAASDLVDVRIYIDGTGLTGLAIASGAANTWWSGRFIRS